MGGNLRKYHSKLSATITFRNPKPTGEREQNDVFFHIYLLFINQLNFV